MKEATGRAETFKRDFWSMYSHHNPDSSGVICNNVFRVSISSAELAVWKKKPLPCGGLSLMKPITAPVSATKAAHLGHNHILNTDVPGWFMSQTRWIRSDRAVSQASGEFRPRKHLFITLPSCCSSICSSNWGWAECPLASVSHSATSSF